MKNNRYIRGILDGLPIGIGYFAVSFAFGISAVQSGLSWLEALLISATNLTSAGQVAGLPIIATSGSLAEMIVTQLIINSRYSLMSVSMSQKFSKNISLLDRFLIAFGNTDEIFGVAISQKDCLEKSYMYGLILTPYIGWSTGTLIGAVAGNILPAIIVSSLGLAIYGMFIAIVVPVVKKESSTALCVLIAVLLSCAFRYIPTLGSVPSGFVTIICAVVPSAIFAVAAPLKTEVSADD